MLARQQQAVARQAECTRASKSRGPRHLLQDLVDVDLEGLDLGLALLLGTGLGGLGHLLGGLLLCLGSHCCRAGMCGERYVRAVERQLKLCSSQKLFKLEMQTGFSSTVFRRAGQSQRSVPKCAVKCKTSNKNSSKSIGPMVLGPQLGQYISEVLIQINSNHLYQLSLATRILLCDTLLP